MSVVLYTTPTCPYCIAAKKLLDDKNITYTDHQYRKLDDDELVALSQKTNGYRTVPQIFINDQFVGGFSDLDKLNKEGKLDQMLGL